MKTFSRSLAFGVLILVVGCGIMGGKSLIVTGDTLKLVGSEFVHVAAVFKDGCDVTKIIAQPDCQRFRVFGEQFQKAYPLNVKLWEAARAGNDTATQAKVSDTINGLAATLSEFAALIIQVYAK